MKFFIHVTLIIFSILGCGIFVVGCKVGPDYCPPSGPDVPGFIEDIPIPEKTIASEGENGQAQYFKLMKDLPYCWWTLFRSKELNALVEKGLENNPTIDAAMASLRQAEENLWAFIGTNMFPNVTGEFEAQREEFSSALFGGENLTPNGTQTTFSLYNASVNVAYTLDTFGGFRRGIEGLAAFVENQQFLLEAAYLTLTSNIVTTAISEASLREQIKATKELIALSESQFKIVQGQFKLGGASNIDVLTQETQLQSIKSLLPPLERNLASARHALAALVGELPSEELLPKFDYSNIKLPIEIPLTIPSRLVCQRPDIRASEALLHQASANIGVATANLFPQITINGSYGSESNFFNTLFQGQSNVWDIGVTVLQPIFNAGALRAQRRAAIDFFDKSFAQYRQTVISAFQNVADTLRALEFDAKTLKERKRGEAAAYENYKLIREQYLLGGVNSLVVLIAEIQYDQAKIARIQAESTRFTDTAALFQALGGGWWNCEGKGQ